MYKTTKKKFLRDDFLVTRIGIEKFERILRKNLFISKTAIKEKLSIDSLHLPKYLLINAEYEVRRILCQTLGKHELQNDKWDSLRIKDLLEHVALYHYAQVQPNFIDTEQL